MKIITCPPKKLAESKLPYSPSARSRLRGVTKRGLGGHKRPLIWGVYAGNAVREHEGVCKANGFPDDGGPSGALSRWANYPLPSPLNEEIYFILTIYYMITLRSIKLDKYN